MNIEHDWQAQLAALKGGPYAGRGGRQALAADLGVPLTTLASWEYRQREPGHENRQRIRRLWEAQGLDQNGGAQ